jgi:uncharacterized membrane-anchored protein YhcB (DUF1043 family)
MKKFILDNKLFSIIVGFLFTSIITYNVLWGTWVTNQIFCHREAISGHVAVQISEERAVSKQMGEVKEEVKGVKEELTTFKKEMVEESVKLRKEMGDNYKDLVKHLIEIKRNGKK